MLDQIAMPDSRAAIEALMRETRSSFRGYVLVVLVLAVIAGLVSVVIAHVDDLARGGRWVRRQMTEPTQQNQWVSTHYDGLRTAGFVVAAVALLWAGIAVAPFVVIAALLGIYLLALGALRRDQPALDPSPTEV